MTKEKIEAVVAEFVALGGAFVEDDYYDTEETGAIYNPVVDRPNAESWLREKLNTI